MRPLKSWWLIGSVIVTLAVGACAPQATPTPATGKPSEAKPADKAAPATKAEPAQGAPTTLKIVTAWTESWVFNDLYLKWAQQVEQKSGGRLKLEYVGGPEVYPPNEQLDPLKRGVIHSIVTSTGYIAGALPETNVGWFGFGATPPELREAGLAEALDTVTREKAGVTLIGFPLQMNFNLYLKKPIDKADLTGLKIRTTASYEPVIKAIGGATVNMPPAEVQTALQTGVVDGLAWPAPFVIEPGFAQFVSYKVEPSWWVGTDVALMEAKTFDALPADLRKLLIDTMIEIEKEVDAHYEGLEQKTDDKLKELGVEVIQLPEAEVKKVHNIHWEEGTKAFLTEPSPQHGAKLKEIMARFAPK